MRRGGRGGCIYAMQQVKDLDMAGNSVEQFPFCYLLPVE